MQIDAQNHFKEIIEPAIGDYEQAEIDLAQAMQVGEEHPIQAARFKALRFGGAAAIYLHHFADIVAKRPPPGSPEFDGQVGKVRELLKERGAVDLVLLGDAADALKHAILTHRLPREVEEAGQVVSISRAYGTGRYGDGTFGGIDQVWLLARSGRKPLATVLNSVRSIWRGLLSEWAL